MAASKISSSKDAKPLLAVVFPMYNEEGNVKPLLDAVFDVGKKNSLNLTVVAVNDGSKDNTLKLLNEQAKKYPTLVVIDNGVNQGLGKTLRNGIEKALEIKADLLGFMDGDLTHDPSVLPTFLDKIEQGYDFVVGSRFVPGGAMVGVPVFRAKVSEFGNFLARLLLRAQVKDYTSGYRVIRKEVFEAITLYENGFGIQIEEVIKAHVAGFKLGDVPIILKDRVFGQSSMKYNFKWLKNYAILFLKALSWVYLKKV